MSEVFSNSKTFVDMKCIYPADQILDNFNELMSNTSNAPSNTEIENFVQVSSLTSFYVLTMYFIS